MRGCTNPEFIQHLNGNFVALACATLYHAIAQWKDGHPNGKVDFNCDTRGGQFIPPQSLVLDPADYSKLHTLDCRTLGTASAQRFKVS